MKNSRFWPRQVGRDAQPVGTTSTPQTVFLAAGCTNFDGVNCLSILTDGFTVDVKISGSSDFKTTLNPQTCGGAPPFSTPGTIYPFVDNPCAAPFTFTPSVAGTQTATVTFGQDTSGQKANPVTLTGSTPPVVK